MTLAPLERTDLTLIEELDWDYQPPCEHSGHPTSRAHFGPAHALVRIYCAACETVTERYYCKKWIEHASRQPTLLHADCGQRSPTDLRILGLVNP